MFELSLMQMKKTLAWFLFDSFGESCGETFKGWFDRYGPVFSWVFNIDIWFKVFYKVSDHPTNTCQLNVSKKYKFRSKFIRIVPLASKNSDQFSLSTNLHLPTNLEGSSWTTLSLERAAAAAGATASITCSLNHYKICDTKQSKVSW